MAKEIQDDNPSDLLGLLEMSDVRPTLDDMREWTAEQCREARQWATARWAARSVMFMGTLRPIPAFLLGHHRAADSAELRERIVKAIAKAERNKLYATAKDGGSWTGLAAWLKRELGE